MAFQKTITLPNGSSGNYIKLGAYRNDSVTREASAQLHLYGSAELSASAPYAPLRATLAKLRLSGAEWESYLGKNALTAAGGNVAAQLYVAAKTQAVISDFGANVFSDADDV